MILIMFQHANLWKLDMVMDFHVFLWSSVIIIWNWKIKTQNSNIVSDLDFLFFDCNKKINCL